MRTTLRDLIDQLEEYADDLGDGTEVMIATQPSWPLAADVATVTAILADEYDDGPRPTPTRVWIAASTGVGFDENPYAPSTAWDGGTIDAARDEVDA